MVLFADTDPSTIGGLLTLAVTNVITLIVAIRKSKGEAIKQEEDQDTSTVAGYRKLMKEREQKHQEDMKSIKVEVSEHKTAIKDLTTKERQCAEERIRQGEQLNNQKECIEDLKKEVDDLKAIIDELQAAAEKIGLQTCQPGVYPQNKYNLHSPGRGQGSGSHNKLRSEETGESQDTNPV